MPAIHHEVHHETHQAAEFYATARGAVAAQLVRARLGALWPAETVRGQALLAVGYGGPYLRLWRTHAYRCVAVSPAQSGLCRWPPGAPNRTCAAEEDSLPFADLAFDRILLVHGLEAAENARRMLREVWRVLKDDGRLLVVAPNRRGLWAHLESTPFGHGQPYSSGQIGRLLAAALFRVERRDTALYVPPTHGRLILRAGGLIERVGRRVAPRLAGVTITEAVKDVYAAMPVARAAVRRRLVLADAA